MSSTVLKLALLAAALTLPSFVLFFQYWNYAKRPDPFGPYEPIRFTITKVVSKG